MCTNQGRKLNLFRIIEVFLLLPIGIFFASLHNELFQELFKCVIFKECEIYFPVIRA